MSNESLNARVSDYKKLLANGEIQATYQSLVGIVQGLRTQFSKRYQREFVVAKVSHGYMDVTYFYLQSHPLKQRKLKLALVLNHRKGSFELWLLGQTKEVQRSYWLKFKDSKWVTGDVMPEYSIFNVPLLENPDFDNTANLFESIHNEFNRLSREIVHALEDL